MDSMDPQAKRIMKAMTERPAAYGRQLGFDKLGDLHNRWIKEMVFGKEDLTLQAHRNSYKTTCVSVALAIILILYPNDRTKFFRKTDTAVKEIVAQVAKMMRHPVTHGIVYDLYGTNLRLLKDNALEISTNLTNDPRGSSQLVAGGINSTVTGQHYNRIFTDDIVAREDRISRAVREATNDAYLELFNIKDQTSGRIVNTGTPWHPDDAFTVMTEPKKWDCYHTGLMTPEQIEEAKEKLTRSLFAINYELKHVADDDIIFRNPQKDGDPAQAEQGWAHVDAAYYGEDYTALTIINYHEDKWFVFGKTWRKHIDECKEEIEEYYHQFKCKKIFTELNADKGMFAKELKKDGLSTATYTETSNKHVKITSYLKFDWKNVIFISGTDEEYINQICDYNENAEHDDCPDSLASIMRELWDKKQKRRDARSTEGLLFL